jgi:hypothetical protein
MGMTKVNHKSVVTPSAEMDVASLKELAGVPAHERLYDARGRVLPDNEVVPTEEQEYGSVGDWERGGS